MAYGTVSMIQQSVNKCLCPSHPPPYHILGTVVTTFQEAPRCPWSDLTQSHLVYKSCFEPHLILALELASLKGLRGRISLLGFPDTLVKHSFCYTCVITLYLLGKMEFIVSHMWLLRSVLWLWKSGTRKERGECGLVNHGPEEIFHMYYDLVLYNAPSDIWKHQVECPSPSLCWVSRWGIYQSQSPGVSTPSCSYPS